MIITIFGKNGAGKTLCAINLAKMFAKQNKFVGIVSPETRYGDLQRVLNVNIKLNKSLKKALIDNSNVKNYFTAYSENIYICALADEEDIVSHITSDENLINDFIKNSNQCFDVLLVDATESAENELTHCFLKNSDWIVNVIDSSAQGLAFYNAHKVLSQSIYTCPEVTVLNKNIKTTISKEMAENIIQHQIDVVVPYKPGIHEKHLLDKAQEKIIAQAMNHIEQIIFSGDQREVGVKAQKGLRQLFAKTPKVGGN